LRILFITNYYPPSDCGWGYMQLCEEVADGLSARGHNIAVLTSTRCDGPEITRPYPVHRSLTIDPDWHSGKSAAWQFFVGRRQREREAVAHLMHLVDGFQPQVIFIWHAIGLPRVLLRAAEQQPGVVTAYYLAGYLPELPDEYTAYWQADPVRGSARLFKRLLAKAALAMLRREGKPILLKYEHVICVSGYVQQRLVDQGLIPAGSVVVHNGVDVCRFASSRLGRSFDGGLKLLCAGRLEPDKGAHHVIEALGLLDRNQRDFVDHLAIVGDGQPEYLAQLQTLVKQYGLSDRVHFTPPVARDRMPQLLDDFDVLVLPSALEALSRMMQEAMAMGLLVIGTTTGGSGELLVHEQTGLMFKAGNAQSLARQLESAITHPDLAARLATAGQEWVRESFRIDQTVDSIEDYLQKLVVGHISTYIGPGRGRQR